VCVCLVRFKISLKLGFSCAALSLYRMLSTARLFLRRTLLSPAGGAGGDLWANFKGRRADSGVL